MGYDKVYKISYLHAYSAYTVKVYYQGNKQSNMLIKQLEHTIHQKLVQNGKEYYLFVFIFLRIFRFTDK